MSHKFLIFCLLNLFFWPAAIISANTTPEERVAALSDFEATKKAQEEIAQISQIAPENYLRDLPNARRSLERFFEHKKGVCNGEFSTVILNPVELTGGQLGEDAIIVRRLNTQERQLCYRELKEMQVAFINNMFKARKEYLDFLHKQRIEELDQTRVRAIDKLNESFSR